MNIIKTIKKHLTNEVINQDLYKSVKNGRKYRFIEPGPFYEQGECSWYEDVETSEKKLLYNGDLESLAKVVPNDIAKYINREIIKKEELL